jgi:hypothetical protein
VKRSANVRHIRSIGVRLLDTVERLRSAGAVAAAVEAHRRPRPADLCRLGIDPSAFARVRLG